MDIKELRINNSLYYGDEIVRVKGIDVTQIMVWVADNNSKPFPTLLDGLEPILLTEELLKELGFEYTSGKRAKCFNIIDNFEKNIGSFNRIKLETGDIDDIEDDFDLRITTNERDLYVEGIRYLHELETFVYLTTKQELI